MPHWGGGLHADTPDANKTHNAVCIHKLAELFESNASESFKRAVSVACTAEGSIAMETCLGDLQNPLQTQRDWVRSYFGDDG